jgi:hypothetical protein
MELEQAKAPRRAPPGARGLAFARPGKKLQREIGGPQT